MSITLCYSESWTTYEPRTINSCWLVIHWTTTSDDLKIFEFQPKYLDIWPTQCHPLRIHCAVSHCAFIVQSLRIHCAFTAKILFGLATSLYVVLFKVASYFLTLHNAVPTRQKFLLTQTINWCKLLRMARLLYPFQLLLLKLAKMPEFTFSQLLYWSIFVVFMNGTRLKEKRFLKVSKLLYYISFAYSKHNFWELPICEVVREC